MLPSFANDTVTIIEPVWVVERGKKVATFPGPGEEIHGCNIQPGATSEDLQLRDNAIVQFTAFLPTGVQVSRFAKIVFDGEEFAIEGRPLRWRSATGGLDHTVLALIDWIG